MKSINYFQRTVTAWVNECRRIPGLTYGGLLLLAAYLYGVLQESFWSDDYPSLTDPNGTFRDIYGDARPIFALLTKYSYIAIGNPQTAWVLRLASLLGLLLLYTKIVANLDSKNWRIPIYVAIGFTVPSFQMYILWAGCWPHVWASIFSLSAFGFWQKNQIKSKLLGLVMLALSFSIYPPSTFFIFSYLFLSAWYKKDTLSKILKDFGKLLSLTVLGCSIGLLISLFAMRIIGITRNPRVELLNFHEIPDKALWIFTRPIVVGFRPFMIDSPAPMFAFLTSTPLVAIYLLGSFYQSKKLRERFWPRTFLVSIILFLSMTPLVLVKGNQFEFRTIAGYSWAILVACLIFIEESLSSAKFQMKSIVVNFLLAALVLIAMCSVNFDYKQLFRDPYVAKTRFLTSELMRCKMDKTRNAILVAEPSLPYPSRNRLGVFSTITDLAHDWVAQPNVLVISEKLEVNLPIVYSSSIHTSTSKQCVIDLEDFRLQLLETK